MITTKRIAIFICAFLISMCCFNVVSSHAVINNRILIYVDASAISGHTNVWWKVINTQATAATISSSGTISISGYSTVSSDYHDFDTAYAALTSESFSGSGYNNYGQGFVQLVITYGNITINNNSSDVEVYTYEEYEDILNPPPDEPEETSWWYDMWHDLGEQMGTPEFWFGEWFVGLIDGIFGNEDDNTITNNVTIGIPSIAPTPTPIPYQTVVVPQINPVTGDTYYTYEYHYNNPSGTPIVATAPPLQPTASAGGGNGGGDYAPINGDPYAMPDLPWLNTTVTIGDDNIDIFDGFGSGLDSIDSVGSEYTEGMNVATNTFGFLPSSWLILIGIGAGIILIAGIISRFLS